MSEVASMLPPTLPSISSLRRSTNAGSLPRRQTTGALISGSKKMSTIWAPSIRVGEAGEHDRYWRMMKAFHVGSQLILPLTFLVFCIFFFFIHPYINESLGRCE